MGNLTLRPYQADLIDAVQREWNSGNSRVVGWLPTGGGKTEIAAGLALQEKQAGGHTLFIVERKPLCRQGAERFQKYGMLPAILRGEDTFVRGYEAITVASIQSLRARADTEAVRGVLDRTTLVIVDEAHVLYQHHDEVLDKLSGANVLGLTATPLREGLGLRYHALVRGPSYDWLMADGYLVRPRYFMPSNANLEAGLKDVEVASTGDYQTGQLSKLMREKTITGDVIGTWQAKAEDRPTIVFCVDIAHSRAVCDEFRAAGISAAHIDKSTDEDERRAIFAAFRAGIIRVLCSVAVLSLGFDEPSASCVILARPTLSLSLHIQQVGRGLRIFYGKQDCLIFDHALNVVRHGKIENFDPPELSQIDAKSDRKRKTDPVMDYRPCPQCAFVLDPRQRICPECGHEIARKNQVHFVPGELSEGPATGTHAMTKEDYKLLYTELAWIANASGYKLGWAWAKLKNEYGFSAPFAWRSLPPEIPRDSTVRLVKSWDIKFAKSRQRAGRASELGQFFRGSKPMSSIPKTIGSDKRAGSGRRRAGDGAGADR